MRYVVIDLNATATAAATDMDENDDLSTRRLDNALGLLAEFLEGFLQFPHDIANRVLATEDTCGVDDGGGLSKLEVRGEEINIGRSAPAEGPVAGAKSIHVLLRHRLLGHPHGCEGFRFGAVLPDFDDLPIAE